MAQKFGCACGKKRSNPANRPLTSAGIVAQTVAGMDTATTTQPRMQGTTQRY